MEEKPQENFDPRIYQLYEEYAHGEIDRRGFIQAASVLLAGSISAEALLEKLSPNYSKGNQVSADDDRIIAERISYPSPDGGGRIEGLLVMPKNNAQELPAVLVVHENRGLNPHIEDVAKRLGMAGFLALAPDALTPLGGYPGSDDEGRQLQSQRKSEDMLQDFKAGARYLADHPQSNKNVGVVGFCFGGGVANDLAVHLPEVIKAAVPFYGRQPDLKLVHQIQGSLLIHYAEFDQRINAGWPAYEEELKKNEIDYQVHFYPGVNHAFHNDTTPRFDQEAASLAWTRTVEFFQNRLK